MRHRDLQPCTAQTSVYIGNTTGVEPMHEPGAPTRRDATGFPTYATTINEPRRKPS